MTTRLVRLTDPAAEPVTLEQAKAHLRVDVDTDDDLISAMISAARDHVEQYCHRVFARSTWAVSLDYFPPGGDAIEIPESTASVDAITYYDGSGDAQSYGLTDLQVDTVRNEIRPVAGGAWPWGSRVKIEVTAGPNTGASPPVLPAPSVVAAIKLVLGDLYENREGGAIGVSYSMNPTVKALLAQHRHGLGM